MKSKLILCMYGVFAALSLNSCKDTDLYEDPSQAIKEEITNRFDFTATFECPVNFSVGYKTLVTVYGDDPETVAEPRKLYAAYTDYDGTYEGIMVLPGEFMGKTLYAKVFNTYLKGVASKTGIAFTDAAVRSTRAAGETHEAMCKRLRDEYYTLLPESKDNRGVLKNEGKVSINILNDGTTLNASFLHSGASIGSKLYYYYYKTEVGGQETFNKTGEAWSTIYNKFGNTNYQLFSGRADNGEIWNQWSNPENGKYYCVGTQSDILFYGENYDQAGTKEFPAGYTVSFFIKMVRDIAGCEGNTRPLYGENWLNSFYWAGQWTHNHVQAAMFKDADTQSLIIGFEDLPERYDKSAAERCDVDYNDEIFVVTVDFNNINKDDIPDLNEEEVDETEVIEGTLLYEDLFPEEGDYDMNDVIIRYKYTKHFDENNKLINGIDYEFTPVTPDGSATYTSGFALMIDDFVKNPITVFTDHKAANGQVFTGTITDGVKGVDKDDVKWNMFNPFIRVGNTGREVHLTKKESSPSASLEGLDDYQKSYVTGDGNFPFAMDIPYLDFVPVTERVRIDVEYPEFGKWVQSNGSDNTDWYLHRNK